MENELTTRLNSMINTLEEMHDILSKSGKTNQSIDMTLFYKNIEDGILDKIDCANTGQLSHIMNSYRFRYYTEYNTDKDLLKAEITRRIRDKRLNKII